jgi:hypothetical protein
MTPLAHGNVPTMHIRGSVEIERIIAAALQMHLPEYPAAL